MGLDVAHYHGWEGPTRSGWWASLSIVKVGLRQIFRRKLYWLVLGLGLAQFLLYWAVIYAVMQLNPPQRVRENILRQFGFSAAMEDPQESGYINFMDRQGLVVMLLLAFSGSLLVGSDFRNKSLTFYLSRRIDRRHYIAGKLLSVGAIVSLLTWIPALLLFIEYGMFSASLDYWLTNWRVPLAVLGYGSVMCTVLSILLVTISAYLQRAAPIAIVWSSMFTMLGLLSTFLRDQTKIEYWALLGPWRDIRYAGRLFFGVFARESQRELAWWALGIVVTLCTFCLVALTRRVRAVDVVE